MHTMDHYRLSRLLDTLKDRPPNLDAMGSEALFSFFLSHQGGYDAHLLFRKGGGKARLATELLAHFADCKRKALACRQEGDVEGARVWEAKCEETYALLPQFARWRPQQKQGGRQGALQRVMAGLSRHLGDAL